VSAKFILPVILVAMILGACAPAPVPAPLNTPGPAVILTASPTAQRTPAAAPEIIPSSTKWFKENASSDCFIQAEFLPGFAGMGDVRRRWGNPPRSWTSRDGAISPGTDTEYWYFDITGHPSLVFERKILDSARYYLTGCTLGEIVEKLGPPEKVEENWSVSCIGGPSFVTQNFHYPSLGFLYFIGCEATLENSCDIFHSGDFLDGKEFYRSTRIIEDQLGFNWGTNVYSWPGFDVSVGPSRMP